MTGPKLYRSIPQEVFDAVKDSDLQALAEFKAKLSGDEVIAARDTVPILDWMIEHMKGATPTDLQEIGKLRKVLLKATAQRKLTRVIDELERITAESLDRALMKASPAMFAMRKLMRDLDRKPDTPSVGDGQGRYRSVLDLSR